ncbi:MAG TPA: phosphatase, partial [bacterium]|nr:phosphatase [bacterium]
MAITAIIFDVDGVIFDSEKIHVRAWEKIFGRMNLVFPRSVYEAGFGVCDREFLLGLKNAGKIPAKADLEALLEEKVHATLSLLEEGVAV